MLCRCNDTSRSAGLTFDVLKNFPMFSLHPQLHGLKVWRNTVQFMKSDKEKDHCLLLADDTSLYILDLQICKKKADGHLKTFGLNRL